MKPSLTGIGARFVFATAAMAAAVMLFFVFEAGYWNPSSGANEARRFQRSVGGVGMGAAATPAWSVLYYDPRLQPVEDSNLSPIPGGYPYSPSAAATVIMIRELPREELQIKKPKR